MVFHSFDSKFTNVNVCFVSNKITLFTFFEQQAPMLGNVTSWTFLMVTSAHVAKVNTLNNTFILFYTCLGLVFFLREMRVLRKDRWKKGKWSFWAERSATPSTKTWAWHWPTEWAALTTRARSHPVGWVLIGLISRPYFLDSKTVWYLKIECTSTLLLLLLRTTNSLTLTFNTAFHIYNY